jgi:hypothetical protein
MQPWTLILTGFLLSVLGTVLPFLMLIHVITSTLFLNFFSVVCMISGLAMGIGGAGQYVRRNKK